MYSPQLNEETVRMLYRLKCMCHKPMTQLADELIRLGMEHFVQEAERRFSTRERQAAPPTEAANGQVPMVGIQLTGTRGL